METTGNHDKHKTSNLQISSARFWMSKALLLIMLLIMVLNLIYNWLFSKYVVNEFKDFIMRLYIWTLYSIFCWHKYPGWFGAWRFDEVLIKVLEAIALEHVGTMHTLMKMWRFGVSRVDQALCECSLFGLFIGKTSLKIVIHLVDHFALIRCIRFVVSFNLLKCFFSRLNDVF